MVKERKNNACVAVKRGVRVRWNYNVFNLAMNNVLKGLPDKIRGQLSRHHTQNKNTSNVHIFESRDIKMMQSCSSTIDTSSQSFQRQDDQEVHAISCFLSKCNTSELLASFPKWTCFFTWGKARGVPDDVYCTLENDVIHLHWFWY